jgi:hypothetical protein
MATKTASSSADVNDTLLLDDEPVLQSDLISDIALMTEESLRELQGKLGIDSMSSKIDHLSEIVEQALTDDSAQPCKQKCTVQFDPCETLDVVPADDGDLSEVIELPPSVFDVSKAQGPKVLEVLAKRVNDSFTKKPINDKLNSLYDKYKSPENCVCQLNVDHKII